MLFSEKFGHKKPKPLQVNGMDQDLHVALWNAVTYYVHFLNRHDPILRNINEHRLTLNHHLWTRFLKLPYDQMPFDQYAVRFGNDKVWQVINNWYFDTRHRQWYEAYDFVQTLWAIAHDEPCRSTLANLVNNELEAEKSGYRFVSGEFTPITNQEELNAIAEAASGEGTALSLAGKHIKKALECFSDKTNPDYRNSMKESISAVETLCKHISGMTDQTLGPALQKTTKELSLNIHLSEGVQKIYKYMSDHHGIRHGLKDDQEPSQEDARFALVTCSAFVNFVAEKARKQGKL